MNAVKNNMSVTGNLYKHLMHGACVQLRWLVVFFIQFYRLCAGHLDMHAIKLPFFSSAGEHKELEVVFMSTHAKSSLAW